MLLPTHALTGALIEKGVDDWQKAVPIAFISHLFLDGLQPQYHRLTPVTGVFSVVATLLACWKFKKHWRSIIAAVCWDLEWPIVRLLGLDAIDGVFHKWMLKSNWTSKWYFGAFEIGIVCLVMAFLWREEIVSRWRAR